VAPDTPGAPGARGPLLALLAVAAVWGSTFVVVKDATERMPVADFLAWRFSLAALVLLVPRPRAVARAGPAGRRTGLVLGLVLGLAYLAQTLGLATTPAAVSGFLTGLFVVLTPLAAAVLLREPPGRTAWAATGLALVGLGLLSLRGLSIGGGELLLVGCAALFALHIVGLGRWAGGADAYGLAVVQLLAVAGLCLLVALPGGLARPPDAGVWVALGFLAVAATALAYGVQTWAQSRLSPTRTALVLAMEPVFGAVFAVGVAGERLGARAMVGAVLVLAAILLTELGPRGGAEGARPRLEV